MHSFFYTEVCTCTFIVALLIITKTSIILDAQKKYVVLVHNRLLFRKKMINSMKCPDKLVELKKTILSEISKIQKHLASFLWDPACKSFMSRYLPLFLFTIESALIQHIPTTVSIPPLLQNPHTHTTPLP